MRSRLAENLPKQPARRVGTMRRSEILEELTNAKRAAVVKLLAGARSQRGHRSLVLRTHPDHNIVGVGVGHKVKRGKSTRTRCVRIYVERKIPRELIHPDHLIPEDVAGVITDVIEAGRFRAYLKPRFNVEMTAGLGPPRLPDRTLFARPPPSVLVKVNPPPAPHSSSPSPAGSLQYNLGNFMIIAIKWCASRMAGRPFLKRWLVGPF